MFQPKLVQTVQLNPVAQIPICDWVNLKNNAASGKVMKAPWANDAFIYESHPSGMRKLFYEIQTSIGRLLDISFQKQHPTPQG